MSYDYTQQRSVVFTESGIQMLFKIRDNVQKLLAVSGAFREDHSHAGVSGDSWDMLACVDYLVERGEIKRVFDRTARQYCVYVSNL